MRQDFACRAQPPRAGCRPAARRVRRRALRGRPGLGALQRGPGHRGGSRVSPRRPSARPRRATVSPSSVSAWSRRTCRACSSRQPIERPHDYATSPRRRCPCSKPHGDEWGLTVACASLLIAEIADGRSSANVAAAAERMVGHARRADYPLFLDWGDTQLRLRAVLRRDAGRRSACAGSTSTLKSSGGAVLPYRDRLLAMLGRFDEAHQLLAEAADRVAELGAVRFRRSGWRRVASEVAMLEGDRSPCGGGGAGGVRGRRRPQASSATSCGSAATSPEALLELGRDDEAEQWLDRGHEIAPTDEAHPRIL